MSVVTTDAPSQPVAIRPTTLMLLELVGQRFETLKKSLPEDLQKEFDDLCALLRVTGPGCNPEGLKLTSEHLGEHAEKLQRLLEILEFANICFF